MPVKPIAPWKEIPFLRLLAPFVAGIIFQWHYRLPMWPFTLIACCCFATMVFLSFTPETFRYRWRSLRGILIYLLLFCAAVFITWQKDASNNVNRLGRWYNDLSAIAVTIEEPLAEKNKSFKADASVDYLVLQVGLKKVNGKIILYFQKDVSLQKIGYGSQIIFKKPLQEIQNSGNPGAFDYRRYCHFQGIAHQVYLKPGEFKILADKKENLLKKIIYRSRERILNVLNKFIPSGRERGVAEALLIGYRDHLDKDLVQSYSNTGVVHVIAISGLHLGLIYAVLLFLFKPFGKRKISRWLRPAVIILILWSFSLLAGASASVLRSAVMFTALIISENRKHQSSIYNSLAASAFLLLCYNPFYLWDVGFQLSYAAVLSILLFQKPIDNWFYFQNKLLNKFWRLNAVTLSAQVLTVPVVMYHFHQFPTLFLFTNLLAVPLSGIILLGEILLCFVAVFPAPASLLGEALQYLISFMNNFIERMDRVPFSVVNGIRLSITETALLFATIAAVAWWLLKKKNAGLIGGLAFFMLFLSARAVYEIMLNKQEKIIVYNVPKLRAIDFISGRNYIFDGDSSLLEDAFMQNFHLKPSRIYHGIKRKNEIQGCYNKANLYLFGNKKILLLSGKLNNGGLLSQKLNPDLIIVTGNPAVYIDQLAKQFNINQIVFDSTNPLWKIQKWKKDCERLHLRFHSVPEQGAFIIDL
ncbi:MAG: ComEC/Rec2 family competence protein [Chitinophagaceae bacterium]|nr:ComEC/Rec2 family competence protein [Chitinophagaceae bacterium]